MIFAQNSHFYPRKTFYYFFTPLFFSIFSLILSKNHTWEEWEISRKGKGFLLLFGLFHREAQQKQNQILNNVFFQKFPTLFREGKCSRKYFGSIPLVSLAPFSFMPLHFIQAYKKVIFFYGIQFPFLCNYQVPNITISMSRKLPNLELTLEGSISFLTDITITRNLKI